MVKLIDVVKWGLTLGKEPQTFLGAKWVPAFLNKVSRSSKRKWALRILEWSPHYFIDGENPKYKGMPLDEYLEISFEINAESRREIYRKILKPYLKKDDTVLEYGCGPGFLARAVSPHVKKVFACDISVGALACARIINNAPNIDFIVADKKGLSEIEDQSLDAIFSFAVIQHLTDEVFEAVLENCRRKLKKGGRLILHIQLEDEVWKTEKDWRSDTSLKGRIKYKYGLHCFGRSKEKHEKLVLEHGFANVTFESLKELTDDVSSGPDSQFLLLAEKK
ncbi:MAG: class I SAM-dependent methyltransferase [Pyrinomonadaceae bacterium]